MTDNNKCDSSFESKMERLEQISKAIQNPDTGLSVAVDLFEEGMKLANEVDKELSSIERRIEIVTSQPDDMCIISEAYTPQTR